MVIAPLEQKRKKVIQFIDQFKSIIDQFEIEKFQNPKYLS
jgi:hypothetical protein